MPELPEVETTRLGLLPHLTGHQALQATVRNPRLRRPIPPDLPSCLAGQRLQDIGRRAKYLLFHFERGCLIVHLGMSGSLRLTTPDEPPGRHDHVEIDFGLWRMRYRDPRRFGLILWESGTPLAHPLLAGLGQEPLDAAFTPAWLFAATRERRTPIKSFIMDGHWLVGVGNIYANESLFRARIHPETPAGALGPDACAALVQAIVQTLLAAIAAGGSSLRDFVGSDGHPGYFQQHYAVYGRHAQPCPVCQDSVQKRVLAQRATFFCPHCQPPPALA